MPTVCEALVAENATKGQAIVMKLIAKDVDCARDASDLEQIVETMNDYELTPGEKVILLAANKRLGEYSFDILFFLISLFFFLHLSIYLLLHMHAMQICHFSCFITISQSNPCFFLSCSGSINNPGER